MDVDLHIKDSLLLPSFRFATVEKNNSTDNGKPLNRNWSSTSSSGFGSWVNSPAGSEFGSTESESDQENHDDYIAELTREMAQYTLQDDDNNIEKTWSEIVSSQEEVLPNIKTFEKLNTDKEVHQFGNKSVPSTGRKPSGPNNVEFQSKQTLIDEQIRAIQFKQDQIAKHINQHQVRQFQGKGRDCVDGFISNAQKGSPRTNDLQQQNQQRTGPQTRAVSLGKPGSTGPSCGGTGVFLPRGTGINDSCLRESFESRKKPGCSTVLMPARVLLALKGHVDKMGDASRLNVVGLSIRQDPLKGDVWYGLQLRQKNQCRTVPAKNHHQEMGLPQEWTY